MRTYYHLLQTHGHLLQTHGHLPQLQDHLPQPHNHFSQSHNPFPHFLKRGKCTVLGGLFCCGLLLGGLTGCEYLPHEANVTLSPAAIQTVVEQSRPANTAIMQAFEQHDLVAIGDYHWNDAFIDYAMTLIQSPAFSEQVQHIVVEFGNGQYQSLINDYVAGKAVSDAQVQEALRGSLYFMAWAPDVYGRFFAAVRVRNAQLPPEQQLHVHLAEAPFDWLTLRDKQVWQQAAQSKSDHFYQVAEERLQQQQKALLIFGAFHLISAPDDFVQREAESSWPLATRLQTHYPGSLYTLWPLTEPAVVSAYQALPAPSLIPVKTTPIQSERMIDILPKARFKLAEMGEREAKVGDLFDAFLYLGESERSTLFPRSVMDDTAWMAEMQRRADLIGGKMQKRFNEIRRNSEAHYRTRNEKISAR